jgi:hypothetical protein
MRCRRMWLPWLCAMGLLSPAVRAQSGSTFTDQNDANATMQRVAAFIGRPASEVAAVWPKTLRGTPIGPSMALSGAIELTIDVRTRGADTVPRLVGVRLVEEVGDTIAFAFRADAALQALRTQLGPPTRCRLPLGAPAALFSPQSPARAWTKGLRGQPTIVEWIVMRGGGMRIVTTVGDVALDDTVDCAVKMP